MANPGNNDSTFEEYFTHNVSPFQPRNALLHLHRVDAAILPADLFAGSTSNTYPLIALLNNTVLQLPELVLAPFTFEATPGVPNTYERYGLVGDISPNGQINELVSLTQVMHNLTVGQSVVPTYDEMATVWTANPGINWLPSNAAIGPGLEKRQDQILCSCSSRIRDNYHPSTEDSGWPYLEMDLGKCVRTHSC